LLDLPPARAVRSKPKPPPPDPNVFTAKEFKVVTLRESLGPDHQKMVDTPERAAEYWRAHIATSPFFNEGVESLVVLLLNTRRKAIAHSVVANGILDTLLVHPREVFRTAIVANSAALILMHNHPSGDPTPSEADIKVTRDLIRAGQLLKIDVLDHVIIGHPTCGKGFISLRELGYWY
jgi:DNA repair protein RadC